MKVYVAQYGCNYESTTTVGVFSTRELAAAYLNKEYKNWGDWTEVVEYEVDVGE